MRNIPGLTSDVVARATRLSEKARDARAAISLKPPTASTPPTKVVDGTVTIRLYDYIDQDGGYWGISANEFAEALDAIESDYSRVELRINSGGGSVWDGLAILNTLRSLDVPVTGLVDGVAASAASFIAVACDELVMMPNSRLMIHDAMGLCIGQAVDMREYAAFLDDTSDNIAEIYAAKAGGETSEWRDRMTAKGLIGEWYSAQQALEAGLSDKIGTSSTEPAEDKVTPPPVDKQSACGCGPKVEGMEHRDECTALAEKARDEQRARFEARRHAENSRKVSA